MTSKLSTLITFVPFCEEGPCRYYRGHHLPHIRQNSCTYFVTFRLADSVPQGQLDQWRHEREIWLGARGIDVNRPNWRMQFESLSLVEKTVFERAFASRLFESLDQGFGECHLKRQNVRVIVEDALRHFDGARFHLGDYALMPNHVHALVTPFAGFELEHILHSIKSWSSSQVNKSIQRQGVFWMKDTYDRLVRDGEELLRTQAYIRGNPSKARLKDGEFSIGTAVYEICN